MALKIVYYEDDCYPQFYPLTYLRPVYTMRAGIVTLYERGRRHFPKAEINLVAREQVTPLVAEEFGELPVNIIKKPDGDVLFVNGRIRDYGDLASQIKGVRVSTRYENQGETVAMFFEGILLDKLPPIATQCEFQKVFDEGGHHIATASTNATLYRHCWEIMADIESEIEADFEWLKPSVLLDHGADMPPGVHIISPEKVHVGDNTTVCPGAILDASAGPIFIGEGCRIDSQAAVYGPCFIGDNTVVVAGKVSGSSIGHTCRVGGEVEESIFHSCVNKYHAGFIGHSYVGPWVNFGAMTTNSDLKNNYSNIRVSLGGQSIDTGSIKVGSFIGDHTKFGIGTLLNTGINIGVCCNIFGGSLVTDKEIPSFRWGGADGYTDYKIDKAIETARRATERRGLPLSSREEQALRGLADGRISDAGIMHFGSLTESDRAEPTPAERPNS